MLSLLVFGVWGAGTGVPVVCALMIFRHRASQGLGTETPSIFAGRIDLNGGAKGDKKLVVYFGGHEASCFGGQKDRNITRGTCDKT